jgi:LruC domain-containing protein
MAYRACDQFPNDPTRAYINSYPSKTGYGSLAFEDNWPFKGDYDINDLVVEYNYTLITNAQNSTVEIDAVFVLKAMGATFKNGFGVQFPFAVSLVQSVTGSRVTNNDVVTLASNGCETGQSKAVIIPFDDATAVTGVNTFANTISGGFHTPDTIRMKILLNAPVTASAMGTIPYNPFIIIDRTRGREAHLAGNLPTDKMNIKYSTQGWIILLLRRINIIKLPTTCRMHLHLRRFSSTIPKLNPSILPIANLCHGHNPVAV